MVRAETGGDLPQLGVGFVTISRLLKAQRPKRWQRRGAGQPCIGLYDLLWFWPVDEVIVYGSALGAERVAIPDFFAKVETGTPGVVEQQTVTPARAKTDEEWNAFIDGVRALLESYVGIP